MNTIYALASARGKAGVAVIRISGPDAWAAVEKLAGKVPEPRVASLRSLKASDGTHLDQALVLCFEQGASFTGEQSAELHTHGGLAVIQAVLRTLSEIDDLRMAEPGEFTRRALDNGCLDLTQVEGLADLIDAETEAQRKQAVRVLEGAIGRKVEQWRLSLIRAAALVEATIDFADEDVPVDVSPEVRSLLDSVIDDINLQLSGARAAERVRHGFEIAIIGAPNVGKSTLLNALAGREAAITSEFAGTTRDVVEVRMDLNGIPVTFLDTAGIRETSDLVEALGIEKARTRAESADLRIFLELDDDHFDSMYVDGDIRKVGKSDLFDRDVKGVSGRTGAGISDLLAEITEILECKSSSASLVVRARHQSAMTSAISALINAHSAIQVSDYQAELIAEDLRQALYGLECLVGRVDVEQLLGEIFSSFCIGK